MTYFRKSNRHLFFFSLSIFDFYGLTIVYTKSLFTLKKANIPLDRHFIKLSRKIGSRILSAQEHKNRPRDRLRGISAYYRSTDNHL